MERRNSENQLNLGRRSLILPRYNSVPNDWTVPNAPIPHASANASIPQASANAPIPQASSNPSTPNASTTLIETWSLPTLPPFLPLELRDEERERVCVSDEQKSYVEHLEQQYKSVKSDQTEVEKRGNDVQGLHVNGLGLFMLMTGVGAGVQKFQDWETLVCFIVLVNLMFLCGVGMWDFITARKIKKLLWDFEDIIRERKNLRSKVVDMGNQLKIKNRGCMWDDGMKKPLTKNLAKERISYNLVKLDRGIFHQDETRFLVLTSIIAVCYMIIVDLVIYLPFAGGGLRYY